MQMNFARIFYKKQSLKFLNKKWFRNVYNELRNTCNKKKNIFIE